MSRSINYADFLDMLGTYGDFSDKKSGSHKDGDKHDVTPQQTHSVKKADTKSTQIEPR